MSNILPTWWWTVVLPACGAFDLVCYAGIAFYAGRKLLPKIRALVADRRGNAASEAAIVLPILLLAAGLGLDGTMAATAKSELIYAVQVATNATAQGMASDAVQSLFASNLAGPISHTSPTLTCTAPTTTVSCTGNGVYAWNFSGLFGIPPTLALVFTATAPIANPSPPPS